MSCLKASPFPWALENRQRHSMAALRPRRGVGRATGALHPGHLLSTPPPHTHTHLLDVSWGSPVMSCLVLCTVCLLPHRSLVKLGTLSHSPCVDTPPVCRIMLARGGSPKCTVKTRRGQRELRWVPSCHPPVGHHFATPSVSGFLYLQ